MAVRQKHIMGLVNQLLEELNVQTGPVPVEKIADSLGVDVRWEPADQDLSGFLLRDPKDRRAIIGVNSKHHKNRQRFTIGHELGHFLLHQGEKVHIDSLNPLGSTKTHYIKRKTLAADLRR
jgi:Zn-dependent peptidase ImmA (M78 family)